MLEQHARGDRVRADQHAGAAGRHRHPQGAAPACPRLPGVADPARRPAEHDPAQRDRRRHRAAVSGHVPQAEERRGARGLRRRPDARSGRRRARPRHPVG